MRHLGASGRQGPATPRRGTTEPIAAADIRVGDILRIGTNQRVPADLVLLRAHLNDASGSLFIRTDQLDGETDWKLRLPVPSCQALPDEWQLQGKAKRRGVPHARYSTPESRELLERLEAAAREALTELKRGRLRQLAELAELGPGAAAIGAGTVPEAAAHPACG